MPTGYANRIAPVESLVFSMNAKPGLYAVLLGSGVSTAAGILTGWGITLELIKQIAVERGEQAPTDPQSWYRDQFTGNPEYPNILGTLGRTPDERQALLRPYFEANDQERAEGIKQPTDAHRAIARLARLGHVKVILTTNFDHLMERALADEGIDPRILSTPDAVKGAEPLVHMNCCLIKLHGDYTDPQILNTENELASYSNATNALLDRIFDDYGLIVCGWSATYDQALRAALMRCQSRRYATYWTQFDEISHEAESVINCRGAEVIPVNGADEFFSDLHERIVSLARVRNAHPLSTAIALQRFKRYLPSAEHRIALTDLVDDVISEAIDALRANTLNMGIPNKSSLESSETQTERANGFRDACKPLLTIGTVGGYYAELEHLAIWSNALARLNTDTPGNGDEFPLGWHGLPSTMLLYSLGIGAVAAANRVKFLGQLFSAVIHRRNGTDLQAVSFLHAAGTLFEGLSVALVAKSSSDDRQVGINVWLRQALRPFTTSLISGEERYSFAFDKLEILMTFAAEAQNKPIGRDTFWWNPANTDQILGEIRASIAAPGVKDQSEYVASGIAWPKYEGWTRYIDKLEKDLGRWRLWNPKL